MKAKMTAAALAMTLGLAAGAANAAPTTTVSPNGHTVQFADGKMAKGSFSYSTTFTEGFSGAMTGFSLNDSFMSSINYTLIDVTDGNKIISSGSALGSHHFSEIFNKGDVFTLTVGGKAGMQNAYYIGTISAVPEPGVWVMMGSGLAMLGFLATRRRSARAV